MSVVELLSRFRALDIKIELAENNLKIDAPEGKLTPALIGELRDNKGKIIDFLQSKIQKRVEYAPLEPVEKKEYYGLSSAQRRLYILQQMESGSVSYNLPHIFFLEGDVNKEKVELVLRKLISRHESLRTSFRVVNNLLVQRVHPDVQLAVEYNELGDEASPGRVTGILNHFTRPFDLERPPLVRVGLIKESETKHIFLFDLHHIITDNLSQVILTREFIALYTGSRLPPLRLQYKDYSHWQNSKRERTRIKQQEEYWLREFKGEMPVLKLPTDYPRPALQSFEGNRVNFIIDREETKQLNRLAQSGGATLFMVLLALFNILLSKLSSQEDIIVGTDVAGRNHADLGSIIGMFANTLPLRNFPTAEKTFKTFLQEVKEKTLKAFENQDYLFEDLVEHLWLSRDLGRNPIFDVMLSFLDNDKEPGEPLEKKNPGPKNSQPGRESYRYERRIAKFDLMLLGVKEAGQQFFIFEYCTKLFKEETVKKFIRYFKDIAAAVMERSDIKIKDIPVSHHLAEAKANTVPIDFEF